MTKIDIISGFLGSGKTTLIRKLIKEVFSGQQVVLIENEFGEIGVDGGFLKDAGIEIREMSQGCICCSLVGDFDKALVEVVNQYHPDRIIIEPSGVGALSDIIKAVAGVTDRVDVEINSLTTMVDVKKCKVFMKNFGDFFNDQIKNANAIIFSRTDVATEKTIEEALKLVRTVNDKAPVITTPIDKLPGEKIYETMEGAPSLETELLEEAKKHLGEHHDDDDDDDEDEHEHHHHHHHDDDDDEDEHEHEHHHHHDHDDDDEDEHEHHHHHHHDHDHHHHHHHHDHEADEVFASWGIETTKKFSREQLENIMRELTSLEYGMVLRAKGMVESPDGTWLYFDMVPGECDIRTGEPDYTGRLCVIGSQIEEEKIEELFK